MTDPGTRTFGLRTLPSLLRASLPLLLITTAGTSWLGAGLDAAEAAAQNQRFALTAQGDSMYYELNGSDIPGTQQNSAGSLTAHSQLNSVGDSNAFMGAPYYGATVETFPGTANGLAPPPFALPFSQFPGYVTASYPAQPTADDSNLDYTIHAQAQPAAAKAWGNNGAPDGSPAPNQQQVASAESSIGPDGAALTSAEGAAAGFVAGPLELGNSEAKASITDVGSAPKISSSVFGRFSVAGEAFGFDKSGFTYLGQSMDQKTALDSANSALDAAHIRIEVAPQSTSTDPATGILTYIIGGLRITTTQTTPSGGQYLVSYTLGRAEVSSVNAANVSPMGAPPRSSANSAGALGSTELSAPITSRPLDIEPPAKPTKLPGQLRSGGDTGRMASSQETPAAPPAGAEGGRGHDTQNALVAYGRATSPEGAETASVSDRTALVAGHAATGTQGKLGYLALAAAALTGTCSLWAMRRAGRRA